MALPSVSILLLSSQTGRTDNPGPVAKFGGEQLSLYLKVGEKLFMPAAHSATDYDQIRRKKPLHLSKKFIQPL